MAIAMDLMRIIMGQWMRNDNNMYVYVYVFGSPEKTCFVDIIHTPTKSNSPIII